MSSEDGRVLTLWVHDLDSADKRSAVCLKNLNSHREDRDPKGYKEPLFSNATCGR